MKSIKKQVILSTLLIIIFVVVSFSLFIYLGLSSHVEQIILEKNRMLSSEVVSRTEMFIDSRISAIKRLGQSAEWFLSHNRRPSRSPDDKNFFRADSNLVYFLVLDKNGNSLLEWSLDKTEVFTQTSPIEKLTLQKGDVWLNTLVSSKTGKTYLGESLQTENLILYAVAKLDALELFSDKGSFSDKSAILLIDNEGFVVSALNWIYPATEADSGYSSNFDAFSIEKKETQLKPQAQPLFTQKTRKGETVIVDCTGTEFWATFKEITPPGWTVIVAESFDEIYSVTRPVLIFSAVLIFVIIIIAFIVLFFESIHILKEVDSFYNVILKYKSGDYGTIIPMPKYEELKPIANAFSEMGESIYLRENSLIQKNTEKEFLLKELHHRVKNNLQVITSLLSLQEPYLIEEKDVFFYKKTRARVSAMAKIHENLYLSENSTRINMKAFSKNFFSVVQDIMEIETIKNTVAGVEFFVSIDVAIPLSLILFELIANSLFCKDVYSTTASSLLEFEVNFDDTAANKKIIFCVKSSKENLCQFDEKQSLSVLLIETLLNQISAKLTTEKSENSVIYFIENL